MNLQLVKSWVMRAVRQWAHGIALSCACVGAFAASAHAATGEANDDVSLRQVKVSFADLGVGSMDLRGVQPMAGVNLGTRMDEVVVAAKLRLRLTYSPSMLPDLSHLRVSLNGQVLAALPLPHDQSGREIEREVELDPRYFSDYNELRFDLIGHYTLDCENLQHSSLWASISQHSELELSFRPLELRNELSYLPAPFFDRRDNRRVELPVVLPARPSRALVRSVGVAASWFGMLADYRGARFPVSFDALPSRHALVFATNASRPAQLQLADVQQPTVSIIDHPTQAGVKLLVFQGRDDAQLQRAVEGVTLGSPVLSGTSATITAVKYERRAAYDAPRWVRTDRPVKLGELVDSPLQLQGSGVQPAPIRVNLRLPPDLFTWNHAGVPVDLRYRYTAPVERDNSLLSVSINNQLLRSYRLRSEADTANGGKLLVPLLQSPGVQQSEGLLIPAFQMASNNQMQFQFAMEYRRDSYCSTEVADNARQSIDPDSTIDLTSFPHYTAMPNLALFANAGYPFTRYADLAETVIVLPDLTSAEHLEQLFFVLGRMGRHTGAVATRYRLVDVADAKQAEDADLLILSGERSNELLATWGKDLGLVLSAPQRKYRQEPIAAGVFGFDREERAGGQAHVEVAASGSLGAFISFESPLTSGRTVVALAGTDDAAARSLVATLENDGKVSEVRGDLAIVRATAVQSYQGEDVYYVGSLSWWKRVWFHISRHPVLLTLIALTLAVVVAMWAYGWLQRRVTRRLAATNAQS